MYGLIGKLIAKEGQRDALIDILREGARDLPGCHRYDVARDQSEPDAIWVTEIWEDKSSHEISLSLPGVLQAISRGKPLMAGFGERIETEPVLSAPGHKPDRYNTVSPYLVVPDALSTIKFLESVLGGIELRRFDTPEGRIVHAEVRVDDTVIMMGEPEDAPEKAGAHVHVYVRDVDRTYEIALENGAHTVQEPSTSDDGDRRGGVRDANGVTWWISAQSAA